MEGHTNRRFPIGAEPVPGGGTHFRVWAPKSSKVFVQAGEERVPLNTESEGYFSGFIAEAKEGMLYKLVLDSGVFPDPASRFQPDGPHGPSQIVDAKKFQWTDSNWRGVKRDGQIIYEMHIGTFTQGGTWRSAMEELPELAKLGVTLLEVMPVADFPGRFGWGYDGVCMFAPTRLYGSPDDFRAFVDKAHSVGLGVMLDVVYNHFGPSGNYFHEFSDDYFSKRYKNEWGEPLNFEDNAKQAREFFITNAKYWVEEFHIDGLRLDATHQIFDASEPHLLAEISREARKSAGARGIFIVAENEAQKIEHVLPFEKKGFNLDAIWNDDFHHTAMVALTGSNEAYYTDYFGSPQEFISAVKHGFLYQGQWYKWQKQPRGTIALGQAPDRFVTFLQNHDQIANSLRGARVHQLASPAQCRALTALLLLGPNTPMLFQGQEFAATSPFFFFADHEPELSALVLKGRQEFLHQFRSLASGAADARVDDPSKERTFTRCKLNFAERESRSEWYSFHRDLIHLRKEDAVFSKPRVRGVDGAVLGPEAFLLRFFGEDGGDRLLIVNLGISLHLLPIPEPLAAPPEGCSWSVLWSSEDPRYGGGGLPEFKAEDDWYIPGHSTVAFAAKKATVDEKTDPKN